MIAVAVVVVAFAFVWLVAGWDIAKSKLPIILSSSATFILIFSLFYVWKLLTIPAKSVQISVGDGEPTVEDGVHIARVKIKNNTHTVLNGELQLLNLDPPNNGNEGFLLKNDITIGPRNDRFINVASYARGSEWFRLIIPSNGFCEPETFGNLPARSHKFHLSFSSLEGFSDTVYCRLFVDSDHILHIEEWVESEIA